MPMKRSAVVLLSGGLDSSTLLYNLIFEDLETFPLAVDYGQRHGRELASAEAVAAYANRPLKIVNIGIALAPIFSAAASSQVGKYEPVPHGHYAAENMRTTIVPNRNMLLLSIAGAYAASLGAGFIAYAAHAGDHAIYPDCRPEFVEAFAKALFLANDPPIQLYAPFARITKTDIVHRGAQFGVPFRLTYSCYEGQAQHCGLCGTCVERREAFREAGVEDPTGYGA